MNNTQKVCGRPTFDHTNTWCLLGIILSYCLCWRRLFYHIFLSKEECTQRVFEPTRPRFRTPTKKNNATGFEPTNLQNWSPKTAQSVFLVFSVIVITHKKSTVFCNSHSFFYQQNGGVTVDTLVSWFGSKMTTLKLKENGKKKRLFANALKLRSRRVRNDFLQRVLYRSRHASVNVCSPTCNL